MQEIILLCATPVAHSLNNTITIQETFDDACPSLTAHKDTLNWEVPVWQWGKKEKKAKKNLLDLH